MEAEKEGRGDRAAVFASR